MCRIEMITTGLHCTAMSITPSESSLTDIYAGSRFSLHVGTGYEPKLPSLQEDIGVSLSSFAYNSWQS